ncbi:MAG: hypothetical protein ABIQ16_19410 [Polyangiaceae bacterium]
MESVIRNVGGAGGVGAEVLVGDAYERVKAELAALKVEELIAVNLDIVAAVSTVLGVFPEMKALRERMAELPGFDLAAFDKLEDYALALSFAQASYLSATRPADDLDALSLEADQLKERLLADAKALALRGLVDGAQLAHLRGGNGNKNLAVDLQILSHVLQEAWPRIQGKSPSSAEDLQLAGRMATRLMRIRGLREQAPALTAAATDARLRAFTKLLHVYGDARSAVAYLRRRRGDADSIVPSLYPGRPRRRAANPDAEAPPATTSGDASPAHSATTTAEAPEVNPAQAAAAIAQQRGAPASKDPFLY